MSNKTVDLLRHAQSLFNKYGINERDPGITNEGREQAFEVGGEYDLVIISPLRRCRETLDSTRIKYKELRVDHLCREKRGSQCDFLYKEDLPQETEEEMFERIRLFKEKLYELNKKYNRILVVSHCVYLWNLTSYVNDKGERLGHRFDNCQLRKFI